MRLWIIAGLAGLLLIVVVGFVVTYLDKYRGAANEVVCANKLREITLFAAHHAHPERGTDPRKLATEVPAGTVVLPGVPAEERLSWFVAVLPGLNQRLQNTQTLIDTIDRTQPWTADRNQQAAKTRLLAALCPGNPLPASPDDPAPTQYVGVAGLGADAATLTVLPPPAPAPPRAGCFRYDTPTPFESITDGLSQSLLLGERSGDLGPWLRGGPATVRGLDDAPGAKPLIGAGGQFGGNHPHGANWAFADGAVRFFTERTDPKVLYGLATIAGKETDALPGE